MLKIIRGDQVILLSGKDKGKVGKVIQVIGCKVLVEGVNLVKKHQKPNPARNVEGGIISKNMPIDISNIALLNPRTGKPDRITIKQIEQNGKLSRVRVFKSDGSQVKL